MQPVTRIHTPTAARSEDCTRAVRPVRPATAEAMLPYRASPKATTVAAYPSSGVMGYLPELPWRVRRSSL